MTIEPIAVSDRYPTRDDCTETGMLWLYDPVSYVISLGWLEPTPEVPRKFTLRTVSHGCGGRPITHWIPASSIQVLSEDGPIP